ncbi:hypothetical protein B0H16DRAFT_1734387 [Mycena metata]|uniref:Uncharacterized protein n=1 Tax=Mycena metata TaxID=1033252 RepID=A0AAD7HV35_9AGAR|nr:hypothetical protein B0H16DRAFT_1734387 [Mycena metata]
MAASIVFARAVIIISLCAILLPFIDFDFIWVVLQFAQAYTQSIVITSEGDVSFSSVNATVFLLFSLAFQSSLKEFYSGCDIHVSANNCSRVDSFGIIGDPRMPISVALSMSIPADIHWLRVSVKADDRYGRDNRTDPGPPWGEPLWYVSLDEEAGEDAGVMADLYRTLHPFITALPAAVPSHHHGRRPRHPTDTNHQSPMVNEYGTATKLLQDTSSPLRQSLNLPSSHGVCLPRVLFGANVVLTEVPRPPTAICARLQHGTLVRQWQAPGLSGPAFRWRPAYPGRRRRAGIVAFIRERLVDVGDDPRLDGKDTDIGANDVEAQTGAGSDDRGGAGTGAPEEEGTHPELGGPGDPAGFQP